MLELHTSAEGKSEQNQNIYSNKIIQYCLQTSIQVDTNYATKLETQLLHTDGHQHSELMNMTTVLSIF